MRFSKGVRVAAASVSLGLLVTGCSGSSSPKSSAAGSTTSTGTSTGTSTSSKPATSAASASPGNSSTNSAKPSSGGTESGSPGTTVSAKATPFTRPAEYPDGIALAILNITQSTITDTGPGALTGKPKTTFTVKFSNNSHGSIALNQVIVQVTFGSARTLAAPVYDNGVADFSGTVAAGKSVQTAYAFSIPTADLTNVSMSVTFDRLHAAATFNGTVKTR